LWASGRYNKEFMTNGKLKRSVVFLALLCCAAGLAMPSQALRGASPRAQLQQPAQIPGYAPAVPQARPRTVTPEDLKKAQKAFEKGDAAEKKEDWQSAFEAYREAVRLAPGRLEYLQRLDVVRSRLVQRHIDQAEREAAVGDIGKARQEMRSASALDPDDTIITERIRELRRLAPDIPLEVPENISQEVRIEPGPGKFSLHIKGDTRSAYEQVARLFGLEVSFDPDLRVRPVRLDADDLDFESMMRVLSFQTGTFYRDMTPKMFFVAEDTVAKRRDYQQDVVRTIPLANSATPDQMTEMFRTVREISGVFRLQLNTASHTITVRASPQDAELVSELVQSLDKPRGQLVLEMEILEVDRNSASQIGLIPPQSATIYSLSSMEIQEAEASATGLVTVLQMLFGTPSNLAGYSTAQLGSLAGAGQLNSAGLIPPLVAFGGGLSTFLATLPGASLNFSTMLSTVKSGQRVLLRTQDGDPATFFVGEKVPVSLAGFSASLTGTSFTPGISGEQFPTANYPTGIGPAGIASADFNNDGVPDLVTANQTANTASILLGNGDGTFQTNVDYPVSNLPVAVGTGDFNNDGNMDIAVVNSCGADPTCKSGVGTVSILLGKGDGTFGTKTDFPTGNFPTSIAVADYNDDGDLDLAVTNNKANTVSILLGNGDGTFKTQVPYFTAAGPISVATADFNGDGFTDLAVADNTANTVSILLGNGDGTFQGHVEYLTGNGPTAVAIADFNLDGFLDLAVTNSTDNTVSILFGNGTGTFGLQTAYPTDTDPVAIIVGDVNVDGLPDIATANKTANDVSILLNAGEGIFTPPLSVPVEFSPEAIVTADFANTGLPDSATANFGSNNVTVLLDITSSTPANANSTATNPLSAYPGGQYEDIGIKIKATPHLHAGGEVSLQFNAEVKSLSSQTFNGIPVINNRSIEQTVRVKENETSILAGFLDDQDTRSVNGIPGLANVPVLGDILSDHSKSHETTELLILITPRLVQEAPRESRILYAGHGSAGAGAGVRGFLPPRAGGFPPDRLPPPVEGQAPLPGGATPIGEPPGGATPEGEIPGGIPGQGAAPGRAPVVPQEGQPTSPAGVP